ncbi:hypothetical protein KFE25_014110 [Diacronema lutheri]|uniref:Carbonic anhydrase n=1 Tax=Diacronema lutheri TaxID=2081491 RepID=A0A8J5XHF3_DIALT|nr:hypothetical protein KFE25_014110 [Diacronema lutheri]
MGRKVVPSGDEAFLVLGRESVLLLGVGGVAALLLLLNVGLVIFVLLTYNKPPREPTPPAKPAEPVKPQVPEPEQPSPAVPAGRGARPANGGLTLSLKDVKLLQQRRNAAVQAKTPREILADIKAGNARFWTGAPETPAANMAAIERRELMGGQVPMWMLLGCADSRVPVGARRAGRQPPAARAATARARARASAPRLTRPSYRWRRARAHNAYQRSFAARPVMVDNRPHRHGAEIVFDQGIGDIFVCRNAGNLYGDTVGGTIDYAVHVLGIKLIVVMGHQGCGAVKAAMAAPQPGEAPKPPKLQQLLNGMRQSLDYCAEVIDRLEDAGARDRESVVANAQAQVRKILAEPGIKAKAQKGELAVIAAFYDIGSGIVDFIEPSQSAGVKGKAAQR